MTKAKGMPMASASWLGMGLTLRGVICRSSGGIAEAATEILLL
jgi:hypothetical protein